MIIRTNIVRDNSRSPTYSFVSDYKIMPIAL